MSQHITLLSTVLVAVLYCICLPGTSAEVALPKWFGDGMVLQTNAKYGARSFLNGQAEPGESVTVNVMSEKQTKTYHSEANTQGDWLIQLDPAYQYQHNNNLTITATGSVSQNTVKASHVSFGDVFFCSGQSNMVYPLNLAFNASQEMETLRDFPNFRFFATARSTAESPQFDLDSNGECDSGVGSCNRWISQEEALKDSGSFLLNFSAVCFLTIRDIARMHTKSDRNQPVALIQTAWGGTRVEAWMSKESIEKTPFASSVPQRKEHNKASVLYNAMVHPWNHFSIRAALWYQGEANANQRIDGIDQTEYYATMYQAMIADWRLKKGIGDFAWGTVQLPPSVSSKNASNTGTGRMEIRVAQSQTAPHKDGLTDISAVAACDDLGGSGRWGIDHPPNKNEIARRLALGLRHAAYGLQEPLWTGPVLTDVSYTQEDLFIALEFSHAGSGLNLRDVKAANIDGTSNDCQKCCSGAPPFEVLLKCKEGLEAEWRTVPRDSFSISGSSIIFDLTSLNLQAGMVSAVRYAWTDYVDCVLENSEGLVSSPFVRPISEALKNGFLRLQKDKASKSEEINFDTHASSVQTPPMGFNSWNFCHCNIDENLVKAIADAMVANGMKSAGYRYVNIDDCWQADRYPNGTILEDPARFPSGMKALTEYVHSRGLLFGLYTSSSSTTCQIRPGSYTYEEIDAQTYCDWGIDYLKNDNCFGTKYPQVNTSWSKFRKGFDACEARTGRPMVLSVEYCGSGDECEEWIAKTANLWRTGGDIQATWRSVIGNIHTQEPMYKIARPGHFNDPDMLQIGNVGLNLYEQHSHMALWCIAGAPLLVGTDLIHASNTTIEILTNAEVLAVNQDLGWKNNEVQGHIVQQTKGVSEVWAKRLADGSWAVLLLNLEDDDAISVTVQWADLGLTNTATADVRNLWWKKDIGTFTGAYTASGVRPHASVFLRVVPTEGLAEPAAIY